MKGTWFFRETDEDWYLAHPAVGGLRQATARDILGVTEDSIRGWVDSYDEAEQDGQLEERWSKISVWATRIGVGRIVIDDVLTDDYDALEPMGFVKRRRGWWEFPRWEFSGSADACGAVLERLWQYPAINLRAFVGNEEVIMVRDHSWDSVFVRRLSPQMPAPLSQGWESSKGEAQ